MLVISPDLVLALKQTPNGHNPAIGYRNIVTRDNVTATSEAELNPAVNLADPTTHRRWRPENAAEHFVTISAEEASDIDYVGLAGHNAATVQSAVSIQRYDDGDEEWVTIAGPTVPGDNSPLMFRFTSIFTSQIRVRFAAAQAPVEVASLYVGELLVMERRILPGFTPITMGIDLKEVTNRSETGNFLGRVITGEGRSSKANFRGLSPAWFRSNMQPFLNAAGSRPFFFAWSPIRYPEETGYVWLTERAVPDIYQPDGEIQIGLSMRGIA